jgi:short-subunit dehydrogenase
MNEYTNMLQVNLNALVKLCHIFLPHLKKMPKAFILNISSTTAYQSVPGLALYSASKSFVQSFSRSLSYELSKTNISVTCISPGGTDTDFVVRANIGIKALNIAKKFNMTPESVAKIAVNAMFNNKTEIVAGLINKIGVFLVWLLPKKIVERNVAKIYELN